LINIHNKHYEAFDCDTNWRTKRGKINFFLEK
jgi:hypothetical protein